MAATDFLKIKLQAKRTGTRMIRRQESVAPNLPQGWEREELSSYGVVVSAIENGQHLGSVTVDEDKRAFKLGVTPVRERGGYSGRGWRAALYRDAVQALRDALARRG